MLLRSTKTSILDLLIDFMKADIFYAVAELIRASTPFGLITASVIVLVLAIGNSEKLVGDRFAYVLGVATGFSAAAAGGYSPQGRQPQNRINADQVDIDQSQSKQ